MSNGVNVTIVEFFPLQVPGLALPPPFGEVSLDPAGVLAGVVSDDACASRPCQVTGTYVIVIEGLLHRVPKRVSHLQRTPTTA